MQSVVRGGHSGSQLNGMNEFRGITVARSNSLRQYSPPQFRRPNDVHNDIPPALMENEYSPTRPPPPSVNYSPTPYGGPQQQSPYNTNSMPRDYHHPHQRGPPPGPYDGRGDPRNDYPLYRNGPDPRDDPRMVPGGGTLDRRFPDGHFQPNGQYPGDQYRGGPPPNTKEYREYRDQREYGRHPQQMNDRVDGSLQRPREREMRPPHQDIRQPSPQLPHLMQYPGQQPQQPPPRSPSGGHYAPYMSNGNTTPTSPTSTLQRQQQGHPGGMSPIPPAVQHYERVCLSYLMISVLLENVYLSVLVISINTGVCSVIVEILDENACCVFRFSGV